MSLTLKILSFNGQPYTGNEVVIGEQGGTIGRADTNTLVLNDENKIISRRHAILEYDNGQFKLTDCSLGGTFIDNAVEPLNNASMPLIDGMQIKIGEYVIGCTIINEMPANKASPLLSPEPGNPFADDNPFADNLDNQLIKENEPPVVTPDKMNGPFASEDGVQDFSDSLMGSDEEQPGADLLNDLENNDLLNQLGGDFKEASDLEPNDLLNAASQPARTDDQSGQGLMSENISSLNDSFEPARPMEDNSILDDNAIPDDFNFAELFNLEGNESQSLTPEQPLQAPPQESAQQQKKQQQPQQQKSQQYKSGRNESVAEPEQSGLLDAPQKIPQSKQVNNVDSNQVVSSQSVSNQASLSNDSELIQAFLRGLQMGTDEIEFSNPEEKMERVGKMLRQFAESTVAVLRSRAEFKSMFRVNVTTIQRLDNNPLKFAITTNDAIKHLINDEQVGFKESVESIDEGFNDLLNHQLAMQAGIQASLNDILKQFDPQTIEKQYAEGLVLQKKSKCWDRYMQIHKRLSETAVEEFFGDAFSEAYEEQMKQLKK